MNRLYSNAVPLFHQSIETHKEIPGLCKETLRCPLYHLALASWYQGGYDTVSELLLEALHGREQSHSVNDPRSISQLLDQALDAYGDRWSYSVDIARVLFLYAQLLNASGKAAEAQPRLKLSVANVNKRHYYLHRTVDNQTDADFE